MKPLNGLDSEILMTLMYSVGMRIRKSWVEKYKVRSCIIGDQIFALSLCFCT